MKREIAPELRLPYSKDGEGYVTKISEFLAQNLFGYGEATIRVAYESGDYNFGGLIRVVFRGRLPEGRDRWEDMAATIAESITSEYKRPTASYRAAIVQTTDLA
jgi:hypothetical protein